MRQDWTAFATAHVPRYTSYPTAAQFGPLGEAETRDWLGRVDPGETISAYVHVPFCEKLCWYCGCHTSVPNGYDRIGRFVETLHREIDLWADALGTHAGTAHLHFGGGSPNALSADDFFGIAEHLRRALNLREDAEFAVELDPRSLTEARIAAMAAVGVNRASLGVQTLDPEVQKAVNRIQPEAMLSAAVKALHNVGISDINADLMYGLPHQTEADLERSAAFCAREGISRVAVFGYAHVPWFAKHQKAIDEAALPGLMERFRQAETAAEALVAEGYVRIGLDHFALPGDELAGADRVGTLRRNFQGYTTDPCQTLVAMGPSAISAFGDGFAQNAKATPAWKSAIEAGQLPTERGCAVSADDRLRARAIEALMCNLAVDLGAVCEEFGVPAGALDGALPGLRALSAAGLCTLEGRRVELLEDARMLVRNVAQCFDAYSRADAPGRHAKAV